MNSLIPKGYKERSSLGFILCAWGLHLFVWCLESNWFSHFLKVSCHFRQFLLLPAIWGGWYFPLLSASLWWLPWARCFPEGTATPLPSLLVMWCLEEGRSCLRWRSEERSGFWGERSHEGRSTTVWQWQRWDNSGGLGNWEWPRWGGAAREEVIAHL